LPCGLFPARIFFSREKGTAGIFLDAKIFAGPGEPDFFCKNRNCRKIHGEAKEWQ
jgi:hypothetical protein